MADHTDPAELPVTRRDHRHHYYNRNGDEITRPSFSRLYDDEVLAGNPARMLQFIERKGDRLIQSICVFPPILHLS